MNLKGSFENKLLIKIPKNYKDNIPLYDLGREITKKVRFYKKKQTMYYVSRDERYKLYEKKIKKFHNIHKDDRCFIVGCGPSINKTNIDLLENEIVIGVNTTYRLVNKNIINCKYFVVGDGRIWKEHYKNILSLDTVLFLGGSTQKSPSLDYLANKNNYEKIQNCDVVLIRSNELIAKNWKWKNKDLSKGSPSCHSIVPAGALPIAYYMGFKEVYLLGIDCDYTGQTHFDKRKVSVDLNRLLSPVFWEKAFKEFETIKKGFEEDGKKIYNATVGGKLEVFERKKLEEVINDTCQKI